MADGTAVARALPARDVLPGSARDNWEVVARQADAWASATIIPADYRGKPANCLVALEMSHRTGIPVLAVMQNLHIIQGKPSWSAQFLIAAANACGRFSPLRYRFFGERGKEEWGCYVVSRDLQTGEELDGEPITLGMAKAEGWSTRSGSKWKTMPGQMLRYRAAAFWARVYAPELAVGMHTSDEVEDYTGAMRSVSPAHAAVAALDAGDPEESAGVALLRSLRDEARGADLLDAEAEESIDAALESGDPDQLQIWIDSVGSRLAELDGQRVGS